MRAATAEREPRAAAASAPARRVLDVALAACALAVLVLPMLVIAVLIRLDSPGPALFRQRRIGLNRRSFTLLKFRTMRVGVSDAPLRELIARELAGEDASSNGSWKIDADARVTRVGAVLRRTSLDELPQLLNVLGGSMSLVGPRPCLEWEAEMFPPAYDARFEVLPGLTGLWQVSGRSTMGTLEMLDLDLRYVSTRSLRGDLGILVRTIPALLGRDGAR
jgi:lipopolysaccharide/colanic/teichoic acid biosynthesis glycosyltransferase